MVSLFSVDGTWWWLVGFGGFQSFFWWHLICVPRMEAVNMLMPPSLFCTLWFGRRCVELVSQLKYLKRSMWNFPWSAWSDHQGCLLSRPWMWQISRRVGVEVPDLFFDQFGSVMMWVSYLLIHHVDSVATHLSAAYAFITAMIVGYRWIIMISRRSGALTL